MNRTMVSQFARRLPARLTPTERGLAGLVAAWVLSMISIPILRWVWGGSVIPLGMSLVVILQVGAAISALGRTWPRARLLTACLVVVLAAWGVEYLGSTTGFPFGRYTYTSALQPQLGGVPLLIPLAWLMMLPSAWAVAALLVGAARLNGLAARLAFIPIAAAAMTAWDFFLDPQMVGWGFWRWLGPPQPADYFGIPLVNFAGWLLASCAITALAHPPIALIGARRASGPLLGIYAITWALQTVGLAAFWGQPGPAIGGGVVMGVMLALALRAYARAETAR
jgi:putative membrane protein